MKRVWTISYRHGRGRYYACDLYAHRQRVASVTVDAPMESLELAVAPPAFLAMVTLQPSADKVAPAEKNS